MTRGAANAGSFNYRSAALPMTGHVLWFSTASLGAASSDGSIISCAERRMTRGATPFPRLPRSRRIR
ncbi:hypothetical protein BURKHO8Y_10361 [Burkholderia sp. 8Y]|nr:hypothetical protein BURKHO8Y_10361 [Burkholderia sp. 8Y]